MSDYDNKFKQLEIINKYNPMYDDIHVGIRKIEDILTFDEAVNEALEDKETYGNYSSYPDITNEMVENALKTRHTIIYSSYEIKQGTFVTMSKMQARDYAGGGRVYSKYINVNEVAWIYINEGMYANVNDINENLKMESITEYGFDSDLNIDDIDKISYVINSFEDEDKDYYDIKCYDINDNKIYSDYIDEDELREIFSDDEELLNRILYCGGNKVYDKEYYIDDLFNSSCDLTDIDEVNNMAKKLFNIAENWYPEFRGYLLYDGTLIEFGDYRDHVEISLIDGMSVGMFVGLGNIRVGKNYIELSTEPSYEQRKVLMKIMNYYSDDEFYVDIVKYSNGRYADTICGAKYVQCSYRTILGEIDRYFDEGIKLMGGSVYESINENMEVEVEPDEIDLSSFDLEDTLNKDIWDSNDKLNSRIRLKLLDIADDFFNSLEVNFVKPIDVILTGSLCSYNWSEFSDIDLHIVVNFNEISENIDFVKEYFDSKKNEWNNEHKDLKIYDYPIELYVQNIDEYTNSNGVYSLEKNSWIKKPSIDNLHEIDNNSSEEIKKIASIIMTRIDDYFLYFDENNNDLHKLEILYKAISNLSHKLKRYRQKGLSKEGESSIPNVVYKLLRRNLYLEDLWELKNKIYDKLNSIE